MNRILRVFCLFAVLYGSSCFSQILPPLPTTATMQNYTQQGSMSANTKGTPVKPVVYNPVLDNTQNQNQSLMQEAENHIKAQSMQDKAMKEAQADIAENFGSRISYSLSSGSVNPDAAFYHQAFDKIVLIDTAYSIKDNVFLTENAYFNNKLDKQEFDQIIKESAAFLTSKMKEQGYDLNSNSAKNFMLFQFFSETLQLKNSKNKHLPFKYDFEDYMGVQDYSKMFVTKLLRTGSGQCHSMPLLYLILAEEVGAEAYLSLSPNHSYIRFPDDNGKWYNVELTNGMFSTASYILQSGYIKSEALQNKIYMENLSRKELLSQQLTDLAAGYIYKFGYDEFAQAVIDKALALYPNSISAHMVKANLDTARFEYVMQQLGINPRSKEQLQRIRNYPEAIALLNTVNSQYSHIDSLGYEPMSPEAYQQWLQAMKGEKEKQEDEKIKNMLKGLNSGTKTLRN